MDQCGKINSKKTEELIAYLLLEKGKCVAKQKIAADLWEGLEPKRAMDNFYKIYKRLQILPSLGIPLKVNCLRHKICLETNNIDSDIDRFEQLCKKGADIESLEEAVRLYRAPLFESDCYAWAALSESHYDLMYAEAIDKLITYFKEKRNNKKFEYYRNLWRKQL